MKACQIIVAWWSVRNLYSASERGSMLHPARGPRDEILVASFGENAANMNARVHECRNLSVVVILAINGAQIYWISLAREFIRLVDGESQAGADLPSGGESRASEPEPSTPEPTGRVRLFPAE
jgi:hypothetical protein